jgi:branched-chain amino acid transport system permease protein
VTAVASPVSIGKRGSPAQRLFVLSVVGTIAYYFILLFFLSLDSSTSGAAAQVALQQVANALSLGAMYALIALGYTMVYGIIELINFAHGDVFMVGAFTSVIVLGGIFGATGALKDPVLLTVYLAVAFIVVLPALGLLGMGIERVFYRPLRKAPRLAPLITAIGVSFILQNIALVVAGSGDRISPQVFPSSWRIEVLGTSIPLLHLFVLVLAILLMVILQSFVGRTRLGRAMRSSAQDSQAAQLMGVDLNQTIAITFLLGAALAGAAGIIWGLKFGFVRQDLGFNAGLKAFTAAVLGGIGNLTGAAVGGFLIAFIEVFATTINQNRWSEAIVFGVLILVLVFRPAGIFGQQLGERA